MNTCQIWKWMQIAHSIVWKNIVFFCFKRLSDCCYSKRFKIFLQMVQCSSSNTSFCLPKILSSMSSLLILQLLKMHLHLRAERLTTNWRHLSHILRSFLGKYFYNLFYNDILIYYFYVIIFRTFSENTFEGRYFL